MSRVRILNATGLCLFSLVFSIIYTLPVNASKQTDHCSGAAQLNVNLCHGYFTGKNYWGSIGIWGNSILLDYGNNANNWAIPYSVVPRTGSSTTNAQDFINLIHNYLGTCSSCNTCYNYNRAGAAFLVDAMLGKLGPIGSCSAGVNYAQNNFNDWANRVKALAASNSIDWSVFKSVGAPEINTMHACSPGACYTTSIGGIKPAYDSHDFAFYKMATYDSDNPEASHEIVFHTPTGLLRIRRECANIVGDVHPLPPIPSAKVTCAADEQPAIPPDPNHGFNITVHLTYSPNMPVGTYPTDAVNTSVTGPEPGTAIIAQKTDNNPSITTNSDGTTDVSSTIAVPATNQSGTFDITWYSTGPAAPTGPSPPCTDTIAIAYEPYFNVTGGDVIAGNGMDVGAACTPQDQYGGVVSWNQEGPTYRGAGTQYAAFALNYLQDFASANTTIPSGSPPIGKPIGLSFSNQAAYVDESGVGSDTYGGGLGAESCVPDYYGTHPATPTDGSGNPTYGQAQFPGANATKVMYISNGTAGGSNLTLSGTINIQNGSHTTIYVDGNVQINGDINFSNNYAGINDIPSFTLIARGNIYVSSGVGHLDGWYIAEPTDSAGDGGILYTCTKAGTDFTAPALDNNLYRSCNITKLTFDGSVVAKQVWLTRTSGTLYNNSPAEVINFMPTLWLTNPPGIGGSPPTTSNYDSITDLPPNL
jgi:hypothetical protein